MKAREAASRRRIARWQRISLYLVRSRRTICAPSTLLMLPTQVLHTYMSCDGMCSTCAMSSMVALAASWATLTVDAFLRAHTSMSRKSYDCQV